MIHPPFDLILPSAQTTSVIFASPHSGRDYGWEFQRQSALDEMQLRSSEDAFVDRLLESAPLCGAPLLCARSPRAYVDLNRAAEELDPALIEGVPRSTLNPRVGSGLGVIPRVVSNARAIYRGKLSMQHAQDRLQAVWHPYHAALQGLIDSTRQEFGRSILIDCHSMPREAIDSFVRAGATRPHVVLGDRFGASASAELVDRIDEALTRAGFITARNTPFAGAYIAQHYGRPSQHSHVVQIEIDRSLYMDEATIAPSPGFGEFAARFAAVITEIAAIGAPGLRQLAAE